MMKATRRLAVLAALALLVSQGLAFAVPQVSQTSGPAPTIKLADLPGEFRAFTVDFKKGAPPTGVNSAFPLMNGNNADGAGEAMAVFSAMSSIYWTRSDMMVFAGKECLVAYRMSFGLKQGEAQDQRDQVVASMRLTYLRTDQISKISPAPDPDVAGLRSLLEKAKIPYDSADPGIAVPDGSPILAAVLFPVFSQAKEAAKRTATLSNAKQLGVGMMIYMSDYDDVIPFVQGTATAKYLLDPYLKNKELWKSLNPAGGEFKMNMAVAGINITVLDNPAQVVLFYEENVWPDGKRAVTFMDSHAKMVDAAEWEKLKKTLTAKYKKSAKPLPLNYGTGKG